MNVLWNRESLNPQFSQGLDRDRHGGRANAFEPCLKLSPFPELKLANGKNTARESDGLTSVGKLIEWVHVMPPGK